VVIGAAELLGEGLTASLADRIGLKRSVAIGVGLSGLCYLLVPGMKGAVAAALGALFLVFLTVEFAIVTALSLCTEVLPAARATMMAGYLGAASIGRVLGALIGGPVWMAGGIRATCLVSALVTALALGIFLWGFRNWRP
jgi:predicted MFS family arabinose efflux permease